MLLQTNKLLHHINRTRSSSYLMSYLICVFSTISNNERQHLYSPHVRFSGHRPLLSDGVPHELYIFCQSYKVVVTLQDSLTVFYVLSLPDLVWGGWGSVGKKIKKKCTNEDFVTIEWKLGAICVVAYVARPLPIIKIKPHPNSLDEAD